MFTCKNGCGYSHNHRGAMNIHENVHCPKVRVTGGKEETKSSPPVTEKECNHEWRLLGGSQAEQIAKSQGFTKYCAKCEDVE